MWGPPFVNVPQDVGGGAAATRAPHGHTGGDTGAATLHTGHADEQPEYAERSRATGNDYSSITIHGSAFCLYTYIPVHLFPLCLCVRVFFFFGRASDKYTFLLIESRVRVKGFFRFSLRIQF